MGKANHKKHHGLFPGFPPEPLTNYWPYPRALNGWWHELSGSEQKCLDYILRHTWGFKKVADYISLSQFQYGVKNLDSGTGLSLPSIVKALSGLERKGFIKKIKTKGKTNNYELLKNFTNPSKINLDATNKQSLDTKEGLTIKDNNNTSSERKHGPEIKELINYLSSSLGNIKFPNYGKQARFAKFMLDTNYSVDDIKWAIDKMKENPWWSENSFDMKNVADEIPKLMTRTFKK